MKVIKTAGGNQTVKMSNAEWRNIGKTAGWIKEAASAWDICSQIDEEMQQLLNAKAKITGTLFMAKELAVNNEDSQLLELVTDAINFIGNEDELKHKVNVVANKIFTYRD